MFAVRVKFRDEDGKVRRGELVNSFRIMIEPCGEVLRIDQENPVELDVMTCSDGETLTMHRIPVLAVIDMKEVVPA